MEPWRIPTRNRLDSALFLWERSGHLVRTVLALYTVIMAIALVYTAEHYVLDIVLGWIDVVVTGFVLQRLWPLHAEPDRMSRVAP
jgi:membrane-associated phospholipid phosphatase